jgi:hypothetical protein
MSLSVFISKYRHSFWVIFFLSFSFLNRQSDDKREEPRFRLFGAVGRQFEWKGGLARMATPC